MRVRHIKQIQQLAAIANEPEVLSAIDPNADFIDLSWVFKKPGALVLTCDGIDGCCIFLPEEKAPQSQRLEIHYLMPGYGGVDAIRAIIDWVFTKTNAQVIFGFTPRSNLAARLINRWLGALPVSERIDGAGRPCIVYELTRDKWASLLADRKARRVRRTKRSAS